MSLQLGNPPTVPPLAVGCGCTRPGGGWTSAPVRVHFPHSLFVENTLIISLKCRWGQGVGGTQRVGTGMSLWSVACNPQSHEVRVRGLIAMTS